MSAPEILLNIYKFPDKVFYGGELGINALQELLTLDRGNVWFKEGFNNFTQPEENCKVVCVNGVVCGGVYAIEELLENE